MYVGTANMPYLANKSIAYSLRLHANFRVPCAFFVRFSSLPASERYKKQYIIQRLIAGTAASRSFHGGGGLVYSRLAAAAMAHGSDV